MAVARRREPRLLRGLALLGATLLALPLVACGSKRGESVGQPAPSRTTPVDHLRPGEIAQGKELAFGLPLPRDIRVSARFPDAVFASGRVGFEALSNYVRERVDAESIDTGPTKTVFVQAAPKADPSRRLRIEVSLQRGMTELTIRDTSRKPPSDAGLSQAERWHQAGVAPDGGPLPDENE